MSISTASEQEQAEEGLDPELADLQQQQAAGQHA